MSFDNGADVVVGIKADHDEVVGSDADRDDGKHAGTDDARSRHRALLFERDRVENGETTLDGERQDQTGRVVGEQVAQVLLRDAEELAVVDKVDRRVRKEPAAGGGQQATDEHADQVDGVRDGEREQVDVGRQLAHLGRREHQHAEGVADQAGHDERQRRGEEDADRRHHALVVARHRVTRRVERTVAVARPRQTVVVI